MEQIPLREALLCINCNTISRAPQRHCPRCAGDQLAAIVRWLDPVAAYRRGGFPKPSREEAARPGAFSGMFGE